MIEQFKSLGLEDAKAQGLKFASVSDGTISYPTHFACSLEEQKLLQRLRQLKREVERELLLVDPLTMEVRKVGKTERLAK